MPTFAFLVPIDPGLCVIPLEKAVVLIGRQSDCDISLTQSRKVSRRHCCLAQVNNQIMARDLGSTNGIYLNGERVKRQCRINVGDEFVIGDLRFRLQLEPNLQPSVSPAPVEKPRREADEAIAMFSSKPTPYLRGVPGGELPSMEVPVILPEEGQDFAVEPSVSRMPAARAHVDDSALGVRMLTPDDSALGVRMQPPGDDSLLQPPTKPPVEDDSGLRLNQKAAVRRQLPPGASGPLVPFPVDEASRNVVPLGPDSVITAPKRKR